MEHMMNENTQLTRRDTWMARIWQMLIDLDEAISTSPLEHLERRVVALEKKVWDSGDPVSEQKTKPKTMKRKRPLTMRAYICSYS
jgi:hypothetical protein